MVVTRNRLLTAGVLFVYLTLSFAEDASLLDADAAGTSLPTELHGAVQQKQGRLWGFSTARRSLPPNTRQLE